MLHGSFVYEMYLRLAELARTHPNKCEEAKTVHLCFEAGKEHWSEEGNTNSPPPPPTNKRRNKPRQTHLYVSQVRYSRYKPQWCS